MEIKICSNALSAVKWTADFIAHELAANPGLVLGLATGRTMEGVYRELVRLHVKHGLGFSRCRTFNLDEYVGLGPDNRQSYQYFMRERLFSRVNINPRHTHLPDGLSSDLEAECFAYEKKIKGSGGIDLQILGIGLNGHLGFNEPHSDFHSRTHVQTLSLATRIQNAPLFPNPDEMPRRAITMGVGTILEARQCLLLATGREKAEIVARAFQGPVTNSVTASVAQKHPRFTVILDADAASKLNSNAAAAA
jgi:glucosamine-6-phosphate deaminase